MEQAYLEDLCESGGGGGGGFDFRFMRDRDGSGYVWYIWEKEG